MELVKGEDDQEAGEEAKVVEADGHAEELNGLEGEVVAGVDELEVLEEVVLGEGVGFVVLRE